MKPRSATIRCLTDCKFAVLNKACYQQVFLVREKKKLERKVKYLKDIPFLKHVSKTKLAKFSYFFQEKEYKRGQAIYQEGEPCRYVFIVKEGEFELKKKFKKSNKVPIDYTEFLSQFPHNKTKNRKERILALSHPINPGSMNKSIYRSNSKFQRKQGQDALTVSNFNVKQNFKI